MSEDNHDADRRRFLRKGLMAAAAVPAGALLFSKPGLAWAAGDLPKLSMDAPVAKALNYHHDASKVDSDARQKGAFCHNCQFYTGDHDAQWGTCTLFPGKLVNTGGWCKSWNKMS